MNIFLTGSSGFVGRNLLNAFLALGHHVTCQVRVLPKSQAANTKYVLADFSELKRPQDWLNFLDHIDVVVNTVGIIRENNQQKFHALHTETPIALFEASYRKGIKLILQLSALGADEEAVSEYHQSKKKADDYLKNLNIPSVILQPSLIYGSGGASAKMFNTLATMPLLVKFGLGNQMIQPVYIQDVVEVFTSFLNDPPSSTHTIAVVGPTALTFTEFIRLLRKTMGLPRPITIRIPLPIVRLIAVIAGNFRSSFLDPDTLRMLERGNTADPAAMALVLGRTPRTVNNFLEPSEITTVRKISTLNWLIPLVRFSIAIVWIITGMISLGIYPISESYALLARVGVRGWYAPLMLYGAAIFDLIIGIAILFIRMKWVWKIQLLLITFYSVIIAWKLPEFLIHPYGPILKNIPMLAVIWLMYSLEEEKNGLHYR